MGELLHIAVASAKAAISVILVLLYGYLWRRAKRITQEGESNISRLGTGLLLPCLLFSEIGPLSTPDNLKSYWPIIAFSLAFQLIAFLVAFVSVRLGMPQHFVPLFVFNNVTSLPLLLLNALSSTGALDSLVPPGQQLDAVVSRARVFILLNALCGNLTRFAFGPYLMQPDKTGHIVLATEDPDEPGAHDPHRRAPRSVADAVWAVLGVVRDALNPPLIGGLLGIVIGVIPWTHTQFFDSSSWINPFTKSLDTVGQLYTALQMFALGAALYSKKGSRTSIVSLAWLFTYRFFIAPAISIGTVYGLRKYYPDSITPDPVLDFVLMLSNVGPPALTLAAIADMADVSSNIEGQIARALVAAYVVTPLIALPCTAIITVASSTGVGR